MIKIGLFSLSAILLTGCIPDDSESTNDFEEFTPFNFKVLSQGTQNDIEGGQMLEVRNIDRYTEVLQTIPSASDVTSTPDFETSHVVFLLANTDACSGLEITEVSENDSTVLITATLVYEQQPFSCPLEDEGSQQLNYAVIEYGRTGMSASVIYKTRFDN